MIELSAEFLSRLQFAFVISFHIIFPSFTIGLASFLVVIEALWLKTKLPVYSEIYSFLIKIFAVVFGMGVVTGIVMQGNCMKFSECQNRLNMVNNKEQMNKEKIDEALRSDRKNSRSKNGRESKAQIELNNIYDIMRSVIRM